MGISVEELWGCLEAQLVKLDVGLEDWNRVRSAYEYAARAFEGSPKEWRRSGDYVMTHPVYMCVLLAMEGERDVRVYEVAILHDVIEDTKVTEGELRQRFDAEVVDAVVAVTKVKSERLTELDAEIVNWLEANYPNNEFGLFDKNLREQVATVAKLLRTLELQDNEWALKVKVADVAHNMLTIAAHKNERTQKGKAILGLNLFGQIAEVMGFDLIRNVIYETSFREFDPIEHGRWSRRIREAYSFDLPKVAKEILGLILEEEIQNMEVQAKWKMSTSWDVALRSKVKSGQEIQPNFEIVCGNYNVLMSVLGNLIELGALSLNVETVTSMATAPVPLEFLVQIEGREFRVTLLPKDFIEQQQQLKLAHLRQFYQDTLQTPDKLLRFGLELTEARGDRLIRVFDRGGRVRDLAAGATVLDMALAIHTDLALEVQRATIWRNGVPSEVGLDEVLQMGDRVALMKESGDNPREVSLPERMDMCDMKKTIKVIERAMNVRMKTIAEKRDQGGKLSLAEEKFIRQVRKRGLRIIEWLYTQQVGRGNSLPLELAVREVVGSYGGEGLDDEVRSQTIDIIEKIGLIPYPCRKEKRDWWLEENEEEMSLAMYMLHEVVDKLIELRATSPVLGIYVENKTGELMKIGVLMDKLGLNVLPVIARADNESLIEGKGSRVGVFMVLSGGEDVDREVLIREANKLGLNLIEEQVDIIWPQEV